MPRGRSKGYANRTDLQSGKPLPVSAPTGLPYGQAKTLTDAQKAVPMGGTSAPLPPAHAQPQSFQPQNTQPVMPSVTPLNAPSERPQENILSGIGQADLPNEVQQLKNNYLSYFEDSLRDPEAPELFRSFVVWLRNQ